MKPTTDKKYPIHEEFYTFQGEGMYMGLAAYFVRLYGCPLHCSWCDSASTWHPKYVPATVDRIPAQEIAKKAKASGAQIVVITGGEPAIHDLTDLCRAIHEQGLRVHIETSGAFELKGIFDWITVSPKWSKLPLPENIFRAKEIKIIVEHTSSIVDWWKEIGPILDTRPSAPPVIWLHPEWSVRNDPKILHSIVEAVKSYPLRYRAGYQIHKMYQADLYDPNSKPTVPLGGDPNKGY